MYQKSYHILMLSHFIQDENSGAAGTIAATARALTRRGHHVTCLWQTPSLNRFKHHRIEELLNVAILLKNKLFDHLEQNSCDVVIASQPYAAYALASCKNKYPFIMRINRSHGWEGRLYEKEKQSLQSGKFNNYFNSFSSTISQLSRSMTQQLSKEAVASSHAVVVGSQLDARYIQHVYPTETSKVFTIAHGVEKDFTTSALLRHSAIERFQQTACRFLFVGQYLPRKGSHWIEQGILALARLGEDFLMTFVVPQTSIEEIEAIYRPTLGRKLQVLSWQSRTDLMSIYLQHDVFLYPSQFEGFGKTWLEAMCSGLYVIGSAEGGFPDLVNNQHFATCMYYPSESQFFQEMLWCMRNPAIRLEKSIVSTSVARKLTWDLCGQQYESLIENLFHIHKSPLASRMGA
jgi:glycosyltransferase involved in cell wall biosynthesis